jgi:restriction modification system DNA specificity domain protein
MDSITMTTEQQLLKGWEANFLKFLCTIKTGDKDVNQGSENGKYPFFTCAQEISNSETFSFEGEAILIAGNGNFNVKFYHGRFEAYQRTYVLQNFKNVDAKYLFYFINNKLGDITKGNRGSTIKYIRLGDIANYPIIYPTSKETQQAIVNKIESLFDEIDEGIGRLKTAAQQIQQYRQSLLKNAFSGELTKEWRSKHADALPSENELLAQIQTAREQHHAQQLADWQTAVSQWEQNGKEGKKPSKPKAPTQAVKFEENVADLPSGWGTAKLESLASEYVLGKMLDKNKNKGKERPYLGNINVRWGYFEFSNAKTMKIEDDEIERYSVKYGDLIICEGGEPGRCAVWKHEAEMFIQKALHRVRFPSYYSADFAFYYLSYAVKLPLVTDLLTGTTIKHLTGTALKNIPFPVCSINEQTQIVAILESKLTACDQVADELAKQLKQAELLKQAVLKAAFSGSLLDK